MWICYEKAANQGPHSLKRLVLVDSTWTIDSQGTNAGLITRIRSTVRYRRVVISTDRIFVINGHGRFVSHLLFLVEGLMMGCWKLDLQKNW